jgi:hypothetical protein
MFAPPVRGSCWELIFTLSPERAKGKLATSQWSFQANVSSITLGGLGLLGLVIRRGLLGGQQNGHQTSLI